MSPQQLPTLASDDAGARLTVFVDRVARGMEPGDAARLAGFTDPDDTAADLLRLPNVRKALQDTLEGRLLSEAAPLAIKVALEILNDDKAPASIKGKMAVAVLDRVKGKEAAPGTEGGSLAGLSQKALEQLVAQLEASGAVVIPRDVTPRPLPMSGNPRGNV